MLNTYQKKKKKTAEEVLVLTEARHIPPGAKKGDTSL